MAILLGSDIQASKILGATTVVDGLTLVVRIYAFGPRRRGYSIFSKIKFLRALCWPRSPALLAEILLLVMIKSSIVVTYFTAWPDKNRALNPTNCRRPGGKRVRGDDQQADQ